MVKKDNMNNLKIIAVIPARYASTRFPAKLVQDLGGKPVVVQTYLATVATQLFDEVLVATDHHIIFDLLKQHNVNVVMSSDTHESGSDRIAEVIEKINCDIVVNVQGDEPFVNKENLESLIGIFKKDIEQKIDLASLMFKITDVETINNPNFKLCLDLGHANIRNKYQLSEWIIELKDHIKHLHLHNNNGLDDQHQSIDEGTINYSEIFQLIEQFNLDVDITLELGNEKAVINSLEFINEYFKKSDF